MAQLWTWLIAYAIWLVHVALPIKVESVVDANARRAVVASRCDMTSLCFRRGSGQHDFRRKRAMHLCISVRKTAKNRAPNSDATDVVSVSILNPLKNPKRHAPHSQILSHQAAAVVDHSRLPRRKERLRLLHLGRFASAFFIRTSSLL
jgi:hypothetical protein